jgi:hypothetical protein
MSPEEICKFLNAHRVAGATGEWIPPKREDGRYGYLENGSVGEGRWLTAEEAGRIAGKLRAEDEKAVAIPGRKN